MSDVYSCDACGAPRERRAARYCLDCAGLRYRQGYHRRTGTKAELETMWRLWREGVIQDAIRKTEVQA